MKSMKAKRKELDRNPRIEEGTVDIADDEFDPKYAKFRMTMWIDLDVIEKKRSLAEAEGMRYQPWINRTLRDLVLGPSALERRIAKLEKAVFKKQAS